MNWKTEYQLQDMDPTQKVGIICKKCGLSQSLTVAELITRFDRQLYLYEAERALLCTSWGCGSAVRLELSHDGLMEGFQGGLA
ncbi:MAG: hypothetical protein DHS20C08_00180 [Rhodomicrobium sp.]|nr:MAG: hypothetical protein DHS20C08_00180 [Rhodomicrobium sp.]